MKRFPAKLHKWVKNGYTLQGNQLVKLTDMKIPKEKKYKSLPAKINLKPLSVNEAWKGRRFKTEKYQEYRENLLNLLPKIKLPAPPYKMFFEWGFSSTLSDYDNAIKNTQDIICEKYKINDKMIFHGEQIKKIVPKGKEYFIFNLTTLHYARQFQSDNSNLEKLLELKEEERKEWARMCILKQDKIYFLQLDKNTEIGNLKMIHDLDQLQNKKQLEIIEGLAKELIKLKSEETNNITKP